MKKIGIYGGTFNPVHIGHIEAVKKAILGLSLDMVEVVPCAEPFYKTSSEKTDAGIRLEMVEEAFSGVSEKIKVSDIEIKRGGINYTVDTLGHFAKIYPDADFYLIVGTDMFLEFEKWHDFGNIFSLATLVCVPRYEGLEKIYEKKKMFEKSFGAKILILECEPYIISSAEIRREIRENGYSKYLLPKTNDFIESEFLFGSDRKMIQRRNIIERLKNSLPEKRLRHILSVERECDFISKTLPFSAEECENMRLAALLHDITRHFSLDEHISLLAKYGKTLPEKGIDFPSVSHSYTGAVIAEEEYKLPCYAVDAIRHHTAGKEDMTLFEKVLWLSDYIEEEREHASCIRRRMEYHSLVSSENPEKALDTALFNAMNDSVEYLERNGKKIHPDSLKALEFLREDIKKYGN